jgi:hypothetical protein
MSVKFPRRLWLLGLTDPDQKWEQTEYPRMFDSAAVVLLQLTLPLYWHSENKEYIGG